MKTAEWQKRRRESEAPAIRTRAAKRSVTVRREDDPQEVACDMRARESRVVRRR